LVGGKQGNETGLGFYSSAEHSPAKLQPGFPLANATRRALNSRMHEDVPIAPIGRHGSGTGGKGAREKKDRSVLVFGAAAGFAIGVLHLFAIAHEWKLRELFDILDHPFISLMGNEVKDVYGPRWLFGMLLYWTFIGWVLGSVFRLIRARVIDGIIISVVRRKTCVYTLLSGVTLGLLVGILNIVSIFNHWKLQDDFFDIVDIPFRSVVYSEVFYSSIPISWTDVDALRVALLMISYWMAASLFFAFLICLVWIGVVRDIVRDRICRCALFFGTSGGLLIGCLEFLAMSHGWWRLAQFIGGFEQPVIGWLNLLAQRLTIPNFLPGYPGLEQHIFFYLLVVFYWTVIGLFIASFYCVIRIGKKRKAETQLSEE
jgi:hypothetical protein